MVCYLEHAVVVAENSVLLRRPKFLVRREITFPGAGIGDALSFCQLRIISLLRGLCFTARSNILDHRHQIQKFAIRADVWRRRDLSLNRRAVLREIAFLRPIIGLLSGDRRAVKFLLRYHIIGMSYLSEVLAGEVTEFISQHGAQRLIGLHNSAVKIGHGDAHADTLEHCTKVTVAHF